MRAFSKRLWLCSAGILAAAALAGSPAAADAADAAPARAAPVTDLGDVVVTARRVEERIQDVPIAVTALSQNKLDTLVVNNVADLNKLAPGMQINGCVSGSSTGGNSCQITIRGFTSTRGSAFGSIGVYFADAPSMFTSNYDLQSIQVLKGPQGTLFGDTVTGGALLYTPKKPSGLKNSGFVSLEGGNLNYHELTGAYEDSFADGKISYRLAGQYRRRAGYAKVHYSFGGTGEVGDVNQLYLRGSLVLKPIEHLENYTVVLFQKDKYNGGVSLVGYTDPRFFSAALRNTIPSATPATAALYEYFTGQLPPAGLTYPQIALAQFNRQAAAGFDETWSDVDGHTMKSYIGIVNQTKWTFNDHLYVRNIYQLRWLPKQIGGNGNYDGVDEPLLQQYGYLKRTAATAYSNDFAEVDNGYNNRQWTDEVQVVGDLFNNRLQLQGGYFHREDRAGDFTGFFPYPYPGPSTPQILSGVAIAGGNSPAATCVARGVPAGTPCFTVTRFSRQSDALFGQATWAVTDKLKLTGGVRRSVITPGVTETGTFATTLSNYTASNGVVVRQPIPIFDPTMIASAPITQTQQPGYKSTTYSITADYKLNDDTLLYIAHRKGFKPGGTNPTLPLTDPLFSFGPETVKDLEFGLKWDWTLAGFTGRTNLAAYKDWYANIQTATRQGGTILVTINGGQAEFRGAELEASVTTPNRIFSISGQVAWEDNKYTEYVETTSCQVQFWRQVPGGQCDTALGIPGTTAITVDHAAGKLTIAAVAPTAALPAGRAALNYTFRPDRIGASPLTWSIRPEIHLEPLLGEDITMSMNIYHAAPVNGLGVGAANLAGVTPYFLDGIYGRVDGAGAYSYPGYTQYDFSADWRHIKGTTVSAYARVTNLANDRRRLGDLITFVSGGTAAPSPSEPRMALVGMKYEF